MNTWAIVVGIFTIIGVIVTVLLIFYNSIDSKIDEKLRNPEFVKKVASEMQLPFLIFDENNRILFDNEASVLIRSIDVKKEKVEVISIVISPKNFMQIPPLIENINSNLDFYETERINKIDLIYKVNKEVGGGFLVDNTYKEPIKKFKLTFLINKR